MHLFCLFLFYFIIQYVYTHVRERKTEEPSIGLGHTVIFFLQALSPQDSDQYTQAQHVFRGIWLGT